MITQRCSKPSSPCSHAVGGAALLGDRAQVRFVGAGHVHEQHVEVTRRDRHVAGFAGDETGVVQGRELVRQLDQPLEVGERAIATASFQVAHERRPVHRRKDLVPATDADRARRVAGVLGEFRWGGRQQLAHQPGGCTHPGALHVRPRAPPQGQCGGIVAKFDSRPLEQPVRLRLDADESLLVEHGVVRNLARHISGGRAGWGAAFARASSPGIGSRHAFDRNSANAGGEYRRVPRRPVPGKRR
jgi:hypothetical protein